MDRGRIGGHFGHPLFDQVPVVVEGLGQRLEGAGPDAGGQEEEDGAFQGGVGQQAVAESRPAPLEGHLGAHFVEDLDPGW